MDERAEAQRGNVPCPRPHSKTRNRSSDFICVQRAFPGPRLLESRRPQCVQRTSSISVSRCTHVKMHISRCLLRPAESQPLRTRPWDLHFSQVFRCFLVSGIPVDPEGAPCNSSFYSQEGASAPETQPRALPRAHTAGGRSASDFQPVAHSTAGPAVPGRPSGNTRQWCPWETVLL